MIIIFSHLPLDVASHSLVGVLTRLVPIRRRPIYFRYIGQDPVLQDKVRPRATVTRQSSKYTYFANSGCVILGTVSVTHIHTYTPINQLSRVL